MLAGWRICPLLNRSWHCGARWTAAALLLLAGTACSVNVVEVRPTSADDSAGNTDVPFGNPGTLVPPSVVQSEAESDVLAIEPLVAFMDACVANAGLVGPCHCAAGRIERSFSVVDLKIFEDRMTGTLEFSPEVAGSLVDCRDAQPPPPWSQAVREAYLDECAVGSDRLRSLCACSLARAQDVVPAHRLADFFNASEVQPDLVDFINLCL